MGQNQAKAKRPGEKLKKSISGHETLVENNNDEQLNDDSSQDGQTPAAVETDPDPTPGSNKSNQAVDVCNDFIEDLQELTAATGLQQTYVIDLKSNEETGEDDLLVTSFETKENVQHAKATNGHSEMQMGGSDLQAAIDQAALAVKQQNFVVADSSAADDTPTEDEGTPKKKRHKAKRSQSRMKRFFSRTSSMRVVPIDSLDNHNEVLEMNPPLRRTPSYIFDIAIIPPPPEFIDGELTEADNREIYRWLVKEKLNPVEKSDYGTTQLDAEHISVTQLFNNMGDGQKSPYLHDPQCLLLIDTRLLEDYRMGHINTAHHTSELLENEEEFSPVKEYTIVVVYDTDGDSYSLTDSDVSKTMQELDSRGANAYVLEGGYHAFQSKFPYICTIKTPASEKERQSLVPNYPSLLVEDNLYLGQVNQANNEPIVRNLQITHMVCVTQETDKPFEDFVEYHHINLTDEPESQIHRFFADCIEFMINAIKTDGKIFVYCNLGQSRSSTIVIAFLMFTRKWSLSDAFKFVKEQRPIIHPNEGFINQLSNFEKSLFGSRISNMEQHGYQVLTVAKTTADQSPRLSINKKVKKLISKKKKTTKYKVLDDKEDNEMASLKSADNEKDYKPESEKPIDTMDNEHFPEEQGSTNDITESNVITVRSFHHSDRDSLSSGHSSIRASPRFSGKISYSPIINERTDTASKVDKKGTSGRKVSLGEGCDDNDCHNESTNIDVDVKKKNRYFKTTSLLSEDVIDNTGSLITGSDLIESTKETIKNLLVGSSHGQTDSESGKIMRMKSKPTLGSEYKTLTAEPSFDVDENETLPTDGKSETKKRKSDDYIKGSTESLLNDSSVDDITAISPL